MIGKKKTAQRLYPGPDAGFTLIEVLVALVLTALLSAGLATAVQTARRVLAATERIATASDVLAARGFLKSSVASAARTLISTTNQDDITFAGTGTRLTLATTYVPKGLHQGLYRLDIDLVPSKSSPGLWDLVAREHPQRTALAAAEAPSAVHSSIILSAIQGARFTYFGKTSRDLPQEQWLDQWAILDASPQLVRLEVTFPSGDQRAWPPLLMPLEHSAE